MDVMAFGGDAAARNSGLMKRATFTATSNVVDMINGVNVKIKLVRSVSCRPTINERPTTVVVKSVLFLRKVELSPSTVLAYAKALENALRKISHKTRGVQDGVYSW